MSKSSVLGVNLLFGSLSLPHVASIAIEATCGRERDPNNKFTPRTLDLDIIHWNDFDGIMEGYKLPDPDIKKHDYISVPLAEIFQD